MIPMNLMKNRVADYIVTGQWAKKAAKEAEKYGKVTVSHLPRIRRFHISRTAQTSCFGGCRLCLYLRKQYDLRHKVQRAAEH